MQLEDITLKKEFGNGIKVTWKFDPSKNIYYSNREYPNHFWNASNWRKSVKKKNNETEQLESYFFDDRIKDLKFLSYNVIKTNTDFPRENEIMKKPFSVPL